MKTTLNKIREHEPCADGWKKLLIYLNKTEADDEPLSLLTIIESNGFMYAVSCLRAVDGHDKELRLFAVDCARRVKCLMKDKRSVHALEVAERYANGDATDEELKEARAEAKAAEDDAWAVGDARFAWAAEAAFRAADKPLSFAVENAVWAALAYHATLVSSQKRGERQQNAGAWAVKRTAVPKSLRGDQR